MMPGPKFPAANNNLQKRWDKRAYEMHVKKKKAVKSRLDTKKPRSFLHLKVNLKRIQSEEERQAAIDYENRILLAKLTNILRSQGQLDNWNYNHELYSKSLNHMKLADEQEKIIKENQRIFKCLKESSSTVDVDKWEDEYLMHNYYLELKDSQTKNFHLDTRGIEGAHASCCYGNDRRNRNDGMMQHDRVPSIGARVTNLALTQAAVSEKSIKEDGLPNMNELTISKTLPKRRRRKQPRLPSLGLERKKEIDRKKKQAEVKATHYDMTDEAVKLFKATKGMGKPESVVITTLAKRKYAQRQQTKRKFEEQYGLNLEEELSSQLDDDYLHLVSALLATRQDYDAQALHAAFKGEVPFVETLVEILCTRNNGALDAIKTAYSSKYNTKLEEEIKTGVKGQLRHLLLALAKGCRSEISVVDNESAERDSGQLKTTQERERWNADVGKMAELLRTASWTHVVTVLHHYETVTGQNIIKELETVLMSDYRDAMVSLVKCLCDCPLFMAEQIHQNLQASGDESTVVRIIVIRSEIDLPSIRKSYKKRFKESLMDGIDKSLPMTCRNALVQMVLMHGAPESKPIIEVEKKSEQKLTPQIDVHPKPLRRPPPNKGLILSPDTPLDKTTAVKIPQAERKVELKKTEKKGQDIDEVISAVSLQKTEEMNYT